MAESKEIKPKSFRITDETAEKFKEISGLIGGNQQQTLSKLIEAYEFQSGKAILSDKKADIEQFERYSNALTRMYMSVLEDNQNITETVRTEFEAQLKSKDAIIQDLQEKLTVSKQSEEQVVDKAKLYEAENRELSNQVVDLKKEYDFKINNLKSMLEDKDKLNRALTDSCNELKLKVDAMTVEHAELEDLRHENVTGRENIKRLENELENANMSHTDALKHLKADLELTYRQKILEEKEKLVAEHQEQMKALIENFKPTRRKVKTEE